MFSWRSGGDGVFFNVYEWGLDNGGDAIINTKYWSLFVNKDSSVSITKLLMA